MTYYGSKELAASFRTVRNNTVKLAEEIPEDQYSFRAAPDCRSVGESLVHIAVADPTSEAARFCLSAYFAELGERFDAGFDPELSLPATAAELVQPAGLLLRHHFESGKAVFELKQGGHHDHIVCVECGHVEEFYDPEIEKRQNVVAELRGFKIQDHSLHMYAECTKPNCPHRQRRD